jgi:hypothetical protein
MPKAKKVKFKGLLQHPIKVAKFDPADWPEVSKEIVDRIQLDTEKSTAEFWDAECDAKLTLLFEHFGIADQNNFPLLAKSLAMSFVPGFRTKEVSYVLEHGSYGAVIEKKESKPGPVPDWSNERLLQLVDDADAIKESKAASTDRKALRILINRRKYPSSIRSKDTQRWLETLEARLQDGRKLKREQEAQEAEFQNLFSAAKTDLEQPQ